MSGKHDAGYFRTRRRAQGIPERDPFSHPRFVQRGRELAVMLGSPALDWPQNLCGNAESIVNLVAQAKFKAGDYCQCGCGRSHNQNVAQTVGRRHGRGFNVIYFWSEDCKSNWDRQRRTGNQANGF